MQQGSLKSAGMKGTRAVNRNEATRENCDFVSVGMHKTHTKILEYYIIYVRSLSANFLALSSFKLQMTVAPMTRMLSRSSLELLSNLRLQMTGAHVSRILSKFSPRLAPNFQFQMTVAHMSRILIKSSVGVRPIPHSVVTPAVSG